MGTGPIQRPQNRLHQRQTHGRVHDSYFKMSAAPNEGAGAEHHEADDDLQDDSGHRRRPLHPADPRPGGQQVLPHTELTALRQLH